MAQPQVPPGQGTTGSSRRPEDWAQRTPDFPAINDGDRVLTYREWDDQANRLADAIAALPHDLQRACVRTHQCLEWFVIHHALSKIGWEHVAINWRLTPAETRDILSDAHPALFFFDDANSGPMIGICADTGIEPVSVVARVPGTLHLPDLIARGSLVPRRSSPYAPFVTYTSGSTGRPLGARKQAPRDAEHRRQIAEYTATSPLKRDRPRGRALLTLPLHHGAGPKTAHTCHERGGTVYLLDRYDPVRALEIIQRHRITDWKTVPTMLQRMRALPPAVLASFDVSSVRAISVGSAPTTWALKEWVMEYFGPVLHEGYGAAEVGMVAVMRPDGHRQRPGSCGRLRPHAEVRVVAPDGTVLPCGAEGEVYIRTPLTITGYLGEDSPDTSVITPDGFFRSGDLGRLDEDNYLYITGRAKDMIIAGGVNIYPAEIEDVLMDHPDVIEAAVIGIPEETFGEQVMAFCDVHPGSQVTERELIGFTESRLAPFKRPRRIEFIAEFPRTATGKILKRDLRAPYWASEDAVR